MLIETLCHDQEAPAEKYIIKKLRNPTPHSRERMKTLAGRALSQTGEELSTAVESGDHKICNKQTIFWS